MMNDQQLTINKKYRPVIGLEVHVELYTKSKMFCRCSADYFGKKPNTHVCPICLGLPGAMPVPNKQALEWCVMIGLALNCEIPLFSKFDRKNYFYPDLPKGFQISQYDKPFCINGSMDIIRHPGGSETTDRISNTKDSIASFQNDRARKKIRIRRVHMEEDTGKLTHATVNGQRVSLIDFNRSGVPLVEIVTEPDFEGAQEVIEYLRRLQQIVRYLGVSSADMEKGDMRLEPNISLRPIRHPGVATTTIGSASQILRSSSFDKLRTAGLRISKDSISEQSEETSPLIASLQNDKTDLPPYKVEVKNINSFKFVEKAINYELARQAEILDRGETPAQETRGWNEQKNATVSQRTKEEAHDYRYFPEPDIPPFRWVEGQISKLKNQIPELPDSKLERFQKEYQISAYDAEILTREKQLADYFEEAVIAGKAENLTPKQVANVIINQKPDIRKVLPATLIKNIASSGQPAAISDKELAKIITRVLEENQKAQDDYRAGKQNALMFLVGQVMRKTAMAIRIDANIVKTKILEKLKV